MKRLAVLFLLMASLCGRGELVPPLNPADLGKADTILLVPVSQAKVFLKKKESDDVILEMQNPIVLKGAAGNTVQIPFRFYRIFDAPLATSYLVFLKGTGDAVEPVSEVGYVVGLSGDFTTLERDLKSISKANPPDVWPYLADCLIDEKDPACALHESYILSDDSAAVVWRPIWDEVEGRQKEHPELWLAYQNIGMQVVGVSAMKGFVEPDFQVVSRKDSTGVWGFSSELILTMAVWFDRGHDHEDYRNILQFVRTQGGQVGMRALFGIQHSTQKSDLPVLLDIFEHSPSIDIRYACLENFYNILGRPYPSGIPGWDDFKKHPGKYTAFWKTRIAEWQKHNG